MHVLVVSPCKMSDMLWSTRCGRQLLGTPMGHPPKSQKAAQTRGSAPLKTALMRAR